MKKGLKILYSLMFSAVALASCSESKMDEINKDTDNVSPDAVAAKYAFTNIQNNLACVTVGGDAMFYVMTYTEQETGTYGQMHETEIRTSSCYNSTTFNNSWYYLYFHLQELKLIEAKCGEGGTDEGSLFNLGIAQVLRALYMGILTDNWGDVPWSQALNVEEYFQPELDSQESIYEDLFANLEAGIDNLESGEYGDIPLDDAQDMIYGQYSSVSGTASRAEAYIKFAYSLKARHLMRLSYVNNYSSTDYDAVIAAAQNGFTSSDDEAKISAFNGVSSITPYASFYDARDYLSLSESFVKKYDERNDPRYTQHAATSAATGSTTKYLEGAAPNGTAPESAAYYSITTSCFDGAAPVMFMSYHELMFIVAEAYARKGDLTNAYAALETAVTNAMVKTGNIATRVYGNTVITADAITTYLDDEVKPRFDVDAIQEIAIQKYLGLYQDGETLETYSDMRRQMAMGVDFGLENPLNASYYPHRLPYGSDDVTCNNYVKDAFGDGTYVYSEPVWWAGGTR
ncbi:MAG: SusD/RagB family nutrient-binding outer membrane lipoprotein [Rikenellaceae bacterium]